MKKIYCCLAIIAAQLPCLAIKDAPLTQEQKQANDHVYMALNALYQYKDRVLSFKELSQALATVAQQIELIETPPSNQAAYQMLNQRLAYLTTFAQESKECSQCLSTSCASCPTCDVVVCLENPYASCADTRFLGQLAALVACTQIGAACCLSYSKQAEKVGLTAKSLKQKLAFKCAPAEQHPTEQYPAEQHMEYQVTNKTPAKI